jgi:hypothetical protein
MSFTQKFSEVSLNFGADVKKMDGLNPFSYMVITSGTFFEVFFEVVLNTQDDSVPFSLKNKFIKNLNSLKKEEIKKIYRYLLYDYIHFVYQFMNPAFKETFPIDFSLFEKEFKENFVCTKKDEEFYNSCQTNYDSGFHSREILKLLKLPAEQDDLFLIETLEEFKMIFFHRFNKTIVNYINISKKGGGSIAKNLRKL